MSKATCVEVHNLKFSWPGAEALTLDISSVKVLQGEKLFVYGPSGSGKSTLLNLIGGVLSPRSGQVKFLGTELKSLKNHSRDKYRGDHMGFIFQQFNLLPFLTAKENVVLPLRFSSRKAEVLRQKGVEPSKEAQRLLSHLGLEQDQLAGLSASQLSVGQQQRVAAARALIGQPELVIADEPTSALDAGAQEDFLSLLFKECERAEASLVFVSHDQRLKTMFDRHVSLEEINTVGVKQ